MNITFSNFSQTLNNISLLSGTTNTLSSNFNNQNILLQELAPITGTVNTLSSNFTILNSNINNVSGTTLQNSADIILLDSSLDSLSIDFTNLDLDVDIISGSALQSTNKLNPNSFGATLTSNNNNSIWSYEKYEKFIVDTNGNSFVLNNIPLTEVVFNLDYDTNYIFDVSVLSGVNLILSSTPFSSEQLASGYITSSGSNIILKIPRNYCNPIFLIDSNNINFGGNDYDKPYLNFGNYTTISGTRNTRNKDQLLCLGNTELYLPKGYEGYKINFNVLNGTTNYYTTNSDTIFGGAISGSISDGGVIAFYTNNNWFIK